MPTAAPIDPWPAPTPASPLSATVVVPGSKSQMNRALPLAALAVEPTTITGALDSRDSELMIEALRALGVGVDVSEDRSIVRVTPGELRGPAQIDCGLAGTVMRFLPPIAALADGPVTLDGDPASYQRPMGPVLRALADLGVEVTGASAGTARAPAGDVPEYLPCVVHGRGGVAGGEVEVDASGSSQFVSALLLAAPRFTRGITVRHVGDRLPSVPHITMTLEALRGRAVAVDDSVPGTWRVEPGPIAGGEVAIEPDLSNAGPFLAAALAAGGEVRVPNWPSVTAQPGDLLRDLLARLGAEVELTGGVLSVRGTGEITPLVADLSLAGELTPTIAALCTLADGTSRLTGIAHLRGHETDRLAALVTEITRLGGQAEELEDGLVIHGGAARLRGAVLETYEDHRMATFAAIIGLAVPGVQIVDVATTRKTIADFPGLWTGMIG